MDSSPRLRWRFALLISCGMLGSTAFGQEANGPLPGTITASPSAQSTGRVNSSKPPPGLPTSEGQIWKEYDISDYTSHVTTTARPEQAVIDWILRETGTEVWFSAPIGLLNADRDTLRVYHTPEMHRLIQEIVDQLVRSQAESYAFGVRLVTVNSPNWRARGLALMQSVSVQTPGVDAWLVTKENAAMLLTELRQRADFKEHQAPVLTIPNGQSQTISRLRPRNYVRSVHLNSNAVGYELETSQIQEGFSLQFNPLMSVDAKTIDMVVKCQIDQIENLLPVSVEVPLTSARQNVRVEVPQIVSWRLHERFRWSTENVLLLSCGVVAAPSDVPTTSNPLQRFIGTPPNRADALLFIECLGPATKAMVDTTRSADRTDLPNRGRY